MMGPETRPGPDDWGHREFAIVVPGEHYRLHVPALPMTIDVERLRRERGETHGQLTVRCPLPGARPVLDDIIVSGTFNLSAINTRKRIADAITERAALTDVDIVGLLEELHVRVYQAERRGQPAVNLQAVIEPTADQFHDVRGLSLPREHATILYGAPDSMKSMIEILILGDLQERGVNTMLVDWELSAEDHKRRLARFFGPDHPPVSYLRADRPLVVEIDRILREIHDRQIAYVALDSVGFGCDGPPEAAEHALVFMRSVRRFGIGALLIAHQSKGEEGHRSPFGSMFWTASARMIYHAKRSDQTEPAIAGVLLTPTKCNLDRRPRPVGLEFIFTGDRAQARTVDVADLADDLSATLSLPQRVRAHLRVGSFTRAELATDLAVPESAIAVVVSRATRGPRPWLVKLPGPNGECRFGLRAAS